MRKSLKIGTIGWRGHAGHIIDMLRDYPDVEVAAVYHPDYKPEVEGGTSCIDDLSGLDGILVLSPNRTHFQYLKHLVENTTAYLFCEKPPVTSRVQLDAIAHFPADRILFNFNLRLSRWADFVDEAMSSGALGEPIHCNIWISHGLAFKDAFATSWRADATQHPHGVLETLGIHYLDLCIALFGATERVQLTESRVSGNGTASDTAIATIKHKSGAISTIVSSYAAPFSRHVQVLGTNGILEMDDSRMCLRSPRDVFNEKGRFTTPPSLRDDCYDDLDIREESLQRTMTYFFDHVRKGDQFPTRLFDQSLDTMRLLLDLCKA